MNAQEALNEIVKLFDQMDLPEDYTRFIELKDGFSKLQQLVDRATPKKPIVSQNYIGEYEECPMCHENITSPIKHNFCSNCGQVIDWSKDE